MDEIDLIPSYYRERVVKLRLIKIFGLVFLCLGLLTGVAYGALEYVNRGTKVEISKLSKIKEITSLQREELRLLKLEKKKLDYQWALLDGLRTAVAAEDLFIAIDNAIQDVDVWFSSMMFQRNEIEIEEKNIAHAGYFFIVTPNDKEQSLAIGTKMHIKGEALNHSSLSTFVNNLIDQSEILDAKVLETSSGNNRDSNIVKFNLSITVNLEREVT